MPVHAGGNSVEHPPHYNSHPGDIECIEVVRHMNFNLGNVVKYLWRSGLKDQAPTLQDLKKAAWYLQDEIERREMEEVALSILAAVEQGLDRIIENQIKDEV